MTHVTPTLTPTKGHALTPAQLRRLADNALCNALHHLRHPGRESLRVATAKANRALTLLKHASQTVTATAVEV